MTREDGESKWTFRKLLNYGIDGLISFNNKPLRMMIYLGMFTFSISILYIIYLLINILINGINIPGYFTTIAAILLLGGIQLMSIGVVGEYIGRIYYEVKHRPKYIVENYNIDMRYNALNLNKNRNNKRSNDLYKLSSFYKVKTYSDTYASNYSQDEGFKERVH